MTGVQTCALPISNIGLISSLCVFAKINELGFIETPYRKVAEGKVDLSDEGLVYLTAEEEEAKIIAQGNAPLNDDGTFVRDKVKSRQDADYPVVPPSEVELMDVSPQQIASIAASLIPFLEHDDANRALMGSNMMRQAVPLLKSEAPIVGTVSNASWHAILVRRLLPRVTVWLNSWMQRLSVFCTTVRRRKSS